MKRRPGRGRRRGRGLGLLLRLSVVLLVAVALLRWAYPLPYRDAIVHHAGRHGLDPALVAAVIRVESSFDPAAVSPKGAMGLMQVMPSTGEWVAARMGLTDFRAEDLHDPEINLAIGTWYLADLLETFDGDLVLALAAYNGGRGNVMRWIEEYPGTVSSAGSSVDERLAEIPFAETRRFVRRVLVGYRLYDLLYPML